MEINNRTTKAGAVRGPAGDSCLLSRLPNVLVIACCWKAIDIQWSLAVYRDISSLPCNLVTQMEHWGLDAKS